MTTSRGQKKSVNDGGIAYKGGQHEQTMGNQVKGNATISMFYSFGFFVCFVKLAAAYCSLSPPK